MTSETTWFQDWSCERQDGVCARTDTIDAITISELDSDPAEAGPVSGFPEERLPLSATPKKLRGIQPLDQDYFDGGQDRGRPFLETSYGDEQLQAAPAMMSDPQFGIDAAFEEASNIEEAAVNGLFGAAFPEAAIGAQFAVLSEKLKLESQPLEVGLETSGLKASEAFRITRTVVRRDGVLVPEDERVTELVSDYSEPEATVQDQNEMLVEPRIKVALERERSDAPVVAGKLAPQNTPRRSNAKILPVIISPYVDARGIYHERSVIWVEVEAADWVME
ncbi:MAG: TraV family lipoprotein [Pseudomonadota bacterium]